VMREYIWGSDSEVFCTRSEDMEELKVIIQSVRDMEDALSGGTILTTQLHNKMLHELETPPNQVSE
jgi:hypothetical protein